MKQYLSSNTKDHFGWVLFTNVNHLYLILDVIVILNKAERDVN